MCIVSPWSHLLGHGCVLNGVVYDSVDNACAELQKKRKRDADDRCSAAPPVSPGVASSAREKRNATFKKANQNRKWNTDWVYCKGTDGKRALIAENRREWLRFTPDLSGARCNWCITHGESTSSPYCTLLGGTAHTDLSLISHEISHGTNNT